MNRTCASPGRSSGAITFSISPSPWARRTPTKTTRPISEPDRPGVARGRVGRERDHEDVSRPDRADDRGQRESAAPPTQHVERHAIRARQVGLADPQPDHRELGGGEGDQHAEREQAGEERDVVVEERRGDHEPRRDDRRGDDRLRRDVGAPAQPAEAARQLAVLAERVREPREARRSTSSPRRAGSARR